MNCAQQGISRGWAAAMGGVMKIEEIPEGLRSCGNWRDSCIRKAGIGIQWKYRSKSFRGPVDPYQSIGASYRTERFCAGVDWPKHVGKVSDITFPRKHQTNETKRKRQKRNG
jgi:hypothetical protein